MPLAGKSYCTVRTTIFLMAIAIQGLDAYNFVCPENIAWLYRAMSYCNATTTYFCLQNNVNYSCVEGCDKLKFERQGQKVFYNGGFDRARCNPDWYQPFKFSTEKASKCAYYKSSCSELGQLVFNDGSFTDNRKCYCDEKNGFAYVSTKYSKTPCNDAYEDCSCYKKEISKTAKNPQGYNHISSEAYPSACDSIKRIVTGSQDDNLSFFFTETTVNSNKHIVFFGVLALVLCASVIFLTLFLTYEKLIGYNLSLGAKLEDVMKNNGRECVIYEMDNIFFVVKNCPEFEPKQLVECSISQGATHLKDVNISPKDLLWSMAKVVVDDLVSEIGKSSVFSIILDESTDSCSSSALIFVYVRYLCSDSDTVFPITRFLGIMHVPVDNADKISSDLQSLLHSFDFKLDKLVGVCIDCASISEGCRNDIVTRLKKVIPDLLVLHCIGHRLSLEVETSADNIVNLVEFQDVLSSVYRYCAKSTKTSELKAIQAVLRSSNMRLNQDYPAKWLSIDGSVQAVVDSFSSLVRALREDNSAKANCLYNSIKTYKFLYTAHFLADVLSQLEILCKAYKRSDVDFTEVTPLLISTVEVLNTIKSEKGTNTARFLSVVKSSYPFAFEGQTIIESNSEINDSCLACFQFVNNVIRYLSAIDTKVSDAFVVEALAKLFDPSLYCQSESDNSIYSNLSKVVGPYLYSCGLGNISDVSQELVGLIKRSQKHDNSARELVQLAIGSSADYPAIAAAAERLLVSPLSTIDCEISFWWKNLLKTDIKNGLDFNTLQHLMIIYLDVHKREDFPFSKAFDKLAEEKFDGT